MTKHLHLEILGTGRPLILLHGWGWHSGIWQPLLPKLIENFQVFLIDLPGCGKSPRLTDSYKIEEISALLVEITPENAIWLGWSLGGMIAWYIAIHYPQQVSELITVATSPKFISEENWPGVSPITLEKFSHLLMQDYQKTLADFLALQLRGTPKNKELFSLLKKQILPICAARIFALSGGLELLRTLDLRPASHKIICRSLHFFGSHDTLIPVNVVEKIKNYLPQGEYEIIKRAGHMPFLSQTDLFIQRLENFLKAYL